MTLYQIIRTVTAKYPAVVPYLSAVALKAETYDGIRAEYYAAIYDAVEGYLTSDRPITAFSNHFREAMAMAFTDAVYEGYQQAGGELPLDADTADWLAGQIAIERGHIVDLFQRLKAEAEADPIDEAIARAEGYCGTLDAVYSEAKLRGSRNISLEFGGDDGKESCPDCQRLKGKRHKVQWIIDNDMIPRPGNANFQCQGHRCEHYWFDPKTGIRYTF